MNQARRFPWKVVLLVALVLVLLPLLALFLVDQFDTRLFRSVVAPRIEELTGRDVEVGQLDLRWGLPLQIHMENLRFANAEWGDASDMLIVPELTVAINPAQLFSGPPYAHVELREPRIAVETSTAGDLNWRLDLPDSTGDEATEPTPLPVTLRSEGGQVHYQDLQNGLSFNLLLDLLTLQPDGGNQARQEAPVVAASLQGSYEELPVTVNSSLQLASEGLWRGEFMLSAGESKLDGKVEANTAGMPPELRAELYSSVLAADELIPVLPSATEESESPVEIELAILQDINAELTLEIAELRLPDMTLADNLATASINAGVLEASIGSSLDSASLDAQLQLDSMAAQPALRIQIELQESPTSPLLEQFDLPDIPGQVAAQVSAELQLDDGEIAFASPALLDGLTVPESSLRYTYEEIQMLMEAEIATAGGSPAIDVELTGASEERITAQVTAPPLREFGSDTYPIEASIAASNVEADLRMNLQNAATSQDSTLHIEVAGDGLPAIPALGFSPPAVPEFALEGEVQKIDGGWSVADLGLELGDSRLAGSLSWQPDQEPPYLRADIDASLIDLNSLPQFEEFLSPAEAAETALEQTAAEAESAISEPGLLENLLPAMNMDLSLEVERLLLPQDFSLTSLHMEARLEDGHLQVEPLAFSTDAGGLDGSLTANADELPASVELSLAFDDLRVAQIVTRAAVVDELTEALSGNLELSFRERSVVEQRDESAGVLPALGRFAMEHSVLNLSTPQGDTRLNFDLSTSETMESDAQRLLLTIEGELRGAPVEGSLHADALQGLRNAEAPYNWMLDLNAADLQLLLDGELLSSTSPPTLEMHLSAQGSDSSESGRLLQPWLDLSLSAFDVTGHLTYQDGDVSVRDLDAQVGDTDLSGSLRYAASARNLVAMLHSTKIDVTELWSLQRGEAASTGSGETEAAASSNEDAVSADTTENGTLLSQEDLNLSFLEDLNAEVAYSADSIYVSGKDRGALQLDLTAEDGQLTIAPLDLEVAEGQLRIESELSTGQAGIQGSLQVEARRLDLDALFSNSELDGDFGLLGGQAKFWLNGTTPAALLGSLEGGLMLMLSDAVIDPLIVEAAALDIGEALLAAAGIGEAMPINCAYASAYAREGRLIMDRVVADTPDSTFYLTGEIDLRQEALDLALHNETKDPTVIASGSPIALRGTFSNPAVLPLTEDLVAEVAQGLALSAVAAPAAALLAFIDTSDAASDPPVCRGWVDNLREAL